MHMKDKARFLSDIVKFTYYIIKVIGWTPTPFFWGGSQRQINQHKLVTVSVPLVISMGFVCLNRLINNNHSKGINHVERNESVKIRWYGMMANWTTIHQSWNVVAVSLYLIWPWFITKLTVVLSFGQRLPSIDKSSVHFVKIIYELQRKWSI